jgi:hypothetical protein
MNKIEIFNKAIFPIIIISKCIFIMIIKNYLRNVNNQILLDKMNELSIKLDLETQRRDQQNSMY